MNSQPKIAIVHDALVNSGGAERVVELMCKAFPDADLYTSVYFPEDSFQFFKTKNIFTLPGARITRGEKSFKRLLPLWIAGFSRLNLNAYDRILTSSTFAAKFIHKIYADRHYCYLYAPFRFLWKPESYSPESLPVSGLVRKVLSPFIPFLKNLDIKTTRRLKKIATTCRNMQTEIKKIYNREAQVIYVPVRVEDYPIFPEPGEYYLSVSRLISHKKIDLVIQACKALDKKLVIVGEGPEMDRLKNLAGDKVIFMGRVKDESRLREIYARSKALIFASHEDYGIAPLESQAAGRPVIAFGAGGVLETVIPGKTGIFFAEQSVDSIVAALEEFEKSSFDSNEIRNSMSKFNEPTYMNSIRSFVLE